MPWGCLSSREMGCWSVGLVLSSSLIYEEASMIGWLIAWGSIDGPGSGRWDARLGCKLQVQEVVKVTLVLLECSRGLGARVLGRGGSCTRMSCCIGFVRMCCKPPNPN